MNLVKYLRENGIKRFFEVLWQYKIEIIFEKIIYLFTKNKPLQDKIIIESHNDFDCNGGAFYNYLIEHNYNKKYKIVWLVRKRVKSKLPMNVETVPLLGPSLKKAYHVCTAKYVTFDCEGVNKLRDDQIVVYCSHGSFSLKSAKGKLFVPDSVNYILTPANIYGEIILEQFSVDKDDPRAISIGYPFHDVLFTDDKSEIFKVVNRKYNKIILWMPTFRKGGGFNRNDSTKEQKLGIPLFDSIEQIKKLNQKLSNENICLIIKIHPKQDLSNLGIGNMSNIRVLTGNDVKKLNIDIYKLLKCVDALISDYSSIAYDFLQLNKPIGYILDDMSEYKLGFVVENIHSILAGSEIYNIDDFEKFIDDIINDNDLHKEKREKLRNDIFEYHDSKSSERLAKLLKL